MSFERELGSDYIVLGDQHEHLDQTNLETGRDASQMVMEEGSRSHRRTSSAECRAAGGAGQYPSRAFRPHLWCGILWGLLESSHVYFVVVKFHFV